MTLLIFDIDGVLGNFEKLRMLRDKAHIAAVAKKKNLSILDAEKLFFQTKQELKSQGKHSTLDTMQHLGISKQEFFEIMNSVPVEGNIVVTEHAQEVLQELSQKHIIVALTNTPSLAMIKTLQHLGLEQYFHKIYSIDTHDYLKPSVKIFRIIQQDFRCKDGFSIGDSV